MPRVETVKIANLPTEWDRYCVGTMRNLIADAILMDDDHKLESAEKWANADRTTGSARVWFVHECLDALENTPADQRIQLSNMILGLAYDNCDKADQKLDDRCFSVGANTTLRIIRDGIQPKNNGPTASYLWQTLEQARHLLNKLSKHIDGNAERAEKVFDCTLLAAQAYAPRLAGEVGYLLEDAHTLAQGNPEREAKLLYTSLKILVPYLCGAAPAEPTRNVIGMISELSGVPLGQVSFRANTLFIPKEGSSKTPHYFLIVGGDFEEDCILRRGCVPSTMGNYVRRIEHAEKPLFHNYPHPERISPASREIHARCHTNERERLPVFKALVTVAEDIFSRRNDYPGVHEAMAQLMENKGRRPDILPLFRQQMASPALSA